MNPDTGEKINPGNGRPYDQATLGKLLKEKHHKVRDDSVITNCSICHR